LTRNDCKEQIEQLNAYGISTFVGRHLRTNIENIKRTIEEAIQSDLTVYLHIDEADYGSGSQQCFKELLLFVKDLPVKLVCYSATCQELLYTLGFDFVVVNFVPHSSYKGTSYFLNNNLVHQAEETFFTYDDKGNLVLM
jgi:hypothetical protein